jgi:hypothetical protein
MGLRDLTERVMRLIGIKTPGEKIPSMYLRLSCNNLTKTIDTSG